MSSRKTVAIVAAGVLALIVAAVVAVMALNANPSTESEAHRAVRLETALAKNSPPVDNAHCAAVKARVQYLCTGTTSGRPVMLRVDVLDAHRYKATPVLYGKR